MFNANANVKFNANVLTASFNVNANALEISWLTTTFCFVLFCRVRELGFPIRKDWHAWQSPVVEGGSPQRAGYVVDYNTTTNFKFATIQGAGHMVPTYKPVR